MVQVARRVLQENGFATRRPARDSRPRSRRRDPVDTRAICATSPWSSIDNDDSRDLDQIEVAEQLADGAIRVLRRHRRRRRARAQGLADRRVRAGATRCTLYTGVHIFPMLPEVLSTDRTSLLDGVDRLAVVTEIVVRPDGTLDDAQTKIYPARVTNHAKLVYERVGAWLEGHGDAAARSARSPRS